MTIVQTSVVGSWSLKDQTAVAVWIHGQNAAGLATTQSIVEAVPPSIWLSTLTVTFVSGVLPKPTVLADVGSSSQVAALSTVTDLVVSPSATYRPEPSPPRRSRRTAAHRRRPGRWRWCRPAYQRW